MIRISSLDLLATFFFSQSRIQLAFWIANTHCQLRRILSSTNIPKSFFARLLSIYLNIYLIQSVEMCIFRQITVSFVQDQCHLFQRNHTITKVRMWAFLQLNNGLASSQYCEAWSYNDLRGYLAQFVSVYGIWPEEDICYISLPLKG